jgi:peptide/nickel transport system substrate-binding protein
MPSHVIAKDVAIANGEKGVKIAAEDMANIATYTKDEYVKNPTVTCGAYKFVSFQDKQVSLVKNENFVGDYRGEQPKIDQIVIKTLNADKDVDTLIAGEVDIINGVIEGEKIEKAQADENIQTSVYARNGYGNMPIATYYGATKEVEVRHALAYLVDTTKIATAAMGSYGLPCYSDYGAAQKVYVDNKEWVNENLNKYAYSIENANAELDKSSYRFEADGKTPFDVAKASESYLRYNEAGEVLTIAHCGSENNSITDNIKTQLLENAPKVGMKYESTITDFASLLDAYYAKGTGDVTYNVYNMATGYSEVPDPEADNHSKWSTNLGGYNSTGIADAELDKCIEAIRACTTEEEYEAAWKDYQVRWNYLLPMIPTYTNNYYDFANKKVAGFKTTPFRNWANEICLFSIE